MGAAWALNKKVVSVILPGSGFNSLGWLTSLDKAIRLDSSEGLDKLYQMLNRNKPDVIDWNKQKQAFLNFCNSGNKRLSNLFNKAVRPAPSFPEPAVSNNKIQVFDTQFSVRSASAGEFQFQLNIRIRANEDIVLKEIFLVNKHEFTGDVSHPKKELNLKYYLIPGAFDIARIKEDKFEETVVSAFDKGRQFVLDTAIGKGLQKSMLFTDRLYTIRQCDGYDELQENNWSLRVTFNVDDVAVIPIEMKIIGNDKGYFINL